MARLLVQVEGLTEEAFVSGMLRDHLLASGFSDVGARIMGNARLRLQLPSSGNGAWPGREKATLLSSEQRAQCVEEAMLSDVAAGMGDARRFVPFVLMQLDLRTCP
jgi:hypothetical protein